MAKKNEHDFNYTVHSDEHAAEREEIKPPVPTSVTLSWDKVEKRRHDRIRAVVTWDEITHSDPPEGVLERMDHYVVQFQISEDDGVSWKTPKRSRTVSAKQDDDEDTSASCGFRSINKEYKYRTRVRSYDSSGSRSDWSAWAPSDSGEYPNVTAPPDPTSVVLRVRPRQFHVEWDAPDFSLDTDADEKEIDSEISYFQVQVASDVGFTSIIKRDRKVSGTKRNFRATKPGTATYYARVRSVGPDGGRSNWVSTSDAKGVPSTPSTPSITFDDKGTRHNRYRALVTVYTITDTDDDIHHYKVQLCNKSTSATPTTGDKRRGVMIDGDATGDDLVAVFKNNRKDYYVSARCRAVDDQGRKSAWSSWSTPTLPSASSSVSAPTGLTLTGRARKLIADWTDPDDETVTRWKVEFGTKAPGFSLKDTQYKHSSHATYVVPRADRDTVHSVKVYAMDHMGNLSSATESSTASPNPTSEKQAAADIDTDAIESTQLKSDSITSKHSIVAAAFKTGTSGNYIVIKDGASDPDKIKFQPSGATLTSDSSNGILFTGANLQFEWGQGNKSHLYNNGNGDAGSIHLGNYGSDPSAPSAGAIIYAKAGHLWAVGASFSATQIL